MVKITSAAASAVVFAAAAAALPVINTPPSITQCTPASLQWSNAEGTVRIFVLPAGQVSAAPIKSLPDQTGASGSYAWTVDIASGTNITIAISDATGTTNYASPLVVLPGSDSSCLNAAASTSSSGTAAAGGASSTAASSSAAATSSRASSSTAASSSSASMASSSSRAASSTSGSGTTSTGSAPAQTSSRAANAAAAFSPATAGLSVIAVAGALLPFL